MAERRMFTQKITDSDAFTEMPLSAQCLYFHLNMHADDDGFLNNANKIRKSINASEDDLKLLILKRFILPFENGVVVIKHWRMHNLLRKDRYNPTQYQDEYAKLILKSDNSYTEKDTLTTTWQPNDNHLATQVSIGKDSIGNNILLSTNVSNNISSFISTEPNEKAVISLILKSKKYFNIYQEQIDYYIDLYPAVNILQELKIMKGWLDANPINRKTDKGIKSFISRWLAKVQTSNNNNNSKHDINSGWDEI